MRKREFKLTMLKKKTLTARAALSIPVVWIRPKNHFSNNEDLTEDRDVPGLRMGFFCETLTTIILTSVEDQRLLIRGSRPILKIFYLSGFDHNGLTWLVGLILFSIGSAL